MTIAPNRQSTREVPIRRGLAWSESAGWTLGPGGWLHRAAADRSEWQVVTALRSLAIARVSW
jgi:hypothetical protein